jgi:hypothetical protein
MCTVPTSGTYLLGYGDESGEIRHVLRRDLELVPLVGLGNNTATQNTLR